MSFLILPMFILLVVLAGISLDIYDEETLREDLQDAVDRGLLAAGSPHQDLDREQVVWAYINARTFNTKQAKANIVVDEQPTYTRITAGAGFDMDTIVFSLLFTDKLPVIASSEAFEGEEKVEISLVLDISGSMARETSTGTSQKRLDVLKGAAKNFVTLLLDRPNADRISISMIPYAGQVNAGMFFDQYVGTREYTFPNANSCVEFEDADFDTAAMPAPGSRDQSPQFQNFRFEKDYGFNAEWGWCPREVSAILPMSNNEALLHARIDAFSGHDGTGTNNAVKWGLGLLDPSMRSVMSALHFSGQYTLPDEFIGRPNNYGDPRSKKYLIVMTDGNIRYQNRPKEEYLGTAGTYTAQFWGELPIYVNGGNRLLSHASKSTLDTTSKRDADEYLRTQQFLSICNKAKENGIRVFTIGYDISETSNAYDEMRTCATTEGDFYHVSGLDLYAAFEQILQNIAKLQLTQ